MCYKVGKHTYAISMTHCSIHLLNKINKIFYPKYQHFLSIWSVNLKKKKCHDNIFPQKWSMDILPHPFLLEYIKLLVAINIIFHGDQHMWVRTCAFLSFGLRAAALVVKLETEITHASAFLWYITKITPVEKPNFAIFY